MNQNTFEHQAFFSTVKINTFPSPGQTSSGTGFLISANLPPPTEGGLPLLISNKHVYRNPDSKIELRFHKKNPLTGRSNLGQIRTISLEQFRAGYTEHPDPDIDLACLNVAHIYNSYDDLFVRHFSVETFGELNENQLIPGADVFIVGYPAGLMDTLNNLPIMRSGSLAMLPDVDFEGRPEFLVDAGTALESQ